MDERAIAIERAQILIKQDDLPDHVRALCAVMLLEGTAYESEIARYLGWDHDRTRRAMVELLKEELTEVTGSR